MSANSLKSTYLTALSVVMAGIAVILALIGIFSGLPISGNFFLPYAGALGLLSYGILEIAQQDATR
ncbi:hypothetical protein KC221_27655, partial [Mycobacterium tuberculosis]|nr:hypothetical protein [Mycobacterium tuberculosis]